MTDRLSKADRWAWLLRWAQKGYALHVHDLDLHMDFPAQTGAPMRTLGDDLRDMHAQGLLERDRLGLTGMSAKWVYAYRINEAGKQHLAKLEGGADV